LLADGVGEARRLDRHAPGGSRTGQPAAPGSTSPSGRTRCGTPSSPPRWMPG
jgi:hypothetical protein